METIEVGGGGGGGRGSGDERWVPTSGGCGDTIIEEPEQQSFDIFRFFRS